MKCFLIKFLDSPGNSINSRSPATNGDKKDLIKQFSSTNSYVTGNKKPNVINYYGKILMQHFLHNFLHNNFLYNNFLYNNFLI